MLPSSLRVPSSAHTPTPRLAFLDTLRAVAALSVLLAHAIREVSPAFVAFCFNWFDLGSFGVTVFFLCSGFIIPASLERHGSLGQFWVQRFFRLFPLYWLSIAGVLVYVALASEPRHVLPPTSLGMVLANATMLPRLFGFPAMLFVYWTLMFELIFYVFVSLLWLARVPIGAAVALGWIGLSLTMEVLVPLGSGSAATVAYVSAFMIMFIGAAYHQHSCGKLAGWQLALITLAGLGVLCASALVNGQLSGAGALFYRFQVSAWLAGYLTFTVIYMLRRLPIIALAPVAYLGTISYSLYLLHPFVLALIPATRASTLSVLIWLVLSVLGSALTYRWLELPMIRLGKHLTSHRHTARPGKLLA